GEASCIALRIGRRHKGDRPRVVVAFMDTHPERSSRHITALMRSEQRALSGIGIRPQKKQGFVGADDTVNDELLKNIRVRYARTKQPRRRDEIGGSYRFARSTWSHAHAIARCALLQCTELYGECK